MKIPVTSPASAPARTAHKRERPMECPLRIIIIQTAPPVAIVPSTVRVRQIQYLVGNINPDCHNAPDQSLGAGAWQR